MRSRKMLYPYLVWMGLFVIVPLCLVVFYAFTDSVTGEFTFSNFDRFVIDDVFLRVCLDSLKTAFFSTLICLIIAYPFAYILSRMKARTQTMLNMLVMVPMWMNFILRICAWQVILDNNGILNRLLEMLGMEKVAFLNTEGAVIVGMVYNFLPFMIVPIYNVMAKIPASLLEASRDLGCNGFQVFRRVILPLSIPGVISGITMVFVPAASTMVIGPRLGGYDLIGDTINQYIIGTAHNVNAGSILSLVLMVIILISMAIMNRFDNGEDAVIL